MLGSFRVRRVVYIECSFRVGCIQPGLYAMTCTKPFPAAKTSPSSPDSFTSRRYPRRSFEELSNVDRDQGNGQRMDLRDLLALVICESCYHACSGLLFFFLSHIGILSNIPDQRKETRLRDSSQ